MKLVRVVCALLAALSVAASLADCFYLPGVAPEDYKIGAPLDLKVVKMTSVKTQLPYEYYTLGFCKPTKIERVGENLGEVLRGDRIMNSPYQLKVLEAKKCQILCTKEYKQADLVKFRKRIRQGYHVQWLIDGLPAATVIAHATETTPAQYMMGFALGVVGTANNRVTDADAVYINNHVDIKLKYHQDETHEGVRIVGFEVLAKSVDSANVVTADQSGACSFQRPSSPQKMTPNMKKITWTYSVQWERSDIAWASRWDTYLALTDGQIHWFSIVNSLVIALFLSGILAMIIVRTLHRDIARYNDEDVQDEALEETGWKLVHGDVFRPPKHAALLAACVGSGIQVFGMVLITITFAMFGFLSPAIRGSLISAAAGMYVLMALFAGYFSARTYKTCKGQNWKRASLMTATLYPAITFGIVFVLNFFFWFKKSSAALPFTTMLAVLALWFGLSVPLVLLGSYFGYRKRPYEHPVRTNQIPRQVPDQVWYMQPVCSVLLAGVLPFGAVFIELFFILTAMWQNEFYYLFGFLFLVFLILVITCSEITIVMVYFQLCSEDYHWWWRSFFMSGGVSVYIFLYAAFYFFTKLEITDFVSALLYFGYTFLMVLTFWFLTGTIGFYAAFVFVRKIYSAVKLD